MSNRLKTEVSTFEFTEFKFRLIDNREVEGFVGDEIFIRKQSLENLRKLLESSNFLDLGWNRIRTSNYVGVIGIGDIKLEILPKFMKGKYDKKLYTPMEIEERETILSNLLFMLSYTGKFTVKEVDFSPLGYDAGLYEVFVYLFAKNLLRLLGYKRDADYVQREDTLRYVKGKIDVKRMFVNYANRHKIPCVFFERSLDTSINRTLKYVSYLLAKRVEVSENFRLLRKVLAVLDPVTLAPIDNSYVQRIMFNRLNLEFKPYIDFCRLILNQSSLSLQGSDIEFFSIVFPMETIFEEFIAEVIRKERLHIEVFGDSEVMIQEGIGYLVTKPRSSLELIPDITIEITENHEKYIIDTKYKPLDPEDRKLGVSPQDLYQMYAYCKISGAKKVLLLYPEGLTGKIENQDPLVLDDEIEIYIRTVPLHYNLKDRTTGWKEFLNSLRTSLYTLT